MRSAVLVCLCIALCVSAVLAADAPAPAAQGASTWLTDYFGAPTTKAKAAYDKGDDKADVCFRTSAWCSQECATGGAECASSTEINSLTCSACPESSDYTNYRSRDYYHGALELAGSRCILNKQFTTPVGLSGKPGINVIGTFTGTCYLIDDRDGHSSCGMPETCENVVASVQGVIYFVQQAVRVGPAATRGTETCTPAATAARAAGYREYDRHYRDGPEEHYGDRHHDPERYGDSDSYYTGPPAQQYVGNATVLSGPFTLHGFHHKLKFTGSHFQHSLFSNVTLSTATAGLPRLGDDVWKWELLADKQY